MEPSEIVFTSIAISIILDNAGMIFGDAALIVGEIAWIKGHPYPWEVLKTDKHGFAIAGDEWFPWGSARFPAQQHRTPRQEALLAQLIENMLPIYQKSYLSPAQETSGSVEAIERQLKEAQSVLMQGKTNFAYSRVTAALEELQKLK